MSEDRVTPGWHPEFSYDLFNGDGVTFAQTIAKFRVWAKEQPRKPLDLSTGWHSLEGETVEQLLIRNTHNREVRYGTVLMYGTSMINKRWKKTGQPIIVTDQGDTEDGQNRLFAAYFTGVPLVTFVVTGVPHEKDLFAYIDNGLARTGEDALKMAGLNGLSKHIAGVIKDFAIRYDDGMLCYVGRMPINPITNVDVLDYARAHPDLASAARTVKDLYPAAVRRIGESKIATFVGWKILEHHDASVLEDFMGMLTAEDLSPSHPVMVLRKRLDEHEAASMAPRRSPKKKQRLHPAQILALTIKAFNLMRAGVQVRRLDPRADDAYPRFDDELAPAVPEAAQ